MKLSTGRGGKKQDKRTEILGAFFAAAKNRAIRLYLLPGKPVKRIPLLSLARGLQVPGTPCVSSGTW
jgi:hypothetical protein